MIISLLELGLCLFLTFFILTFIAETGFLLAVTYNYFCGKYENESVKKEAVQ